MAYIGKRPTDSFRSLAVKDTFTGDGSTVAFDISQECGSANDLMVFVDNVRQEPGSGKSYTLGVDGSGLLKRITFDAAPDASAEIYVINPTLSPEIVAVASLSNQVKTTAITSETAETDHSTLWAKYTVGMATVGFQRSALDNANADEDRDAMAISLAINENMSVSYGVSSVEFEASGKTDEDSSGISASYTTGGMTISAVSNATDAVAGSAATDKEYKEVSVSFAF